MEAQATAQERVTHSNGHPHTLRYRTYSPQHFPTDFQSIPPQYLPGGRKSLPGISGRAFCLGIAFGICSLSAVQLSYFGYDLWRIPWFVATLAVFHYLEFDMTARFNPPDASLASFLLFNNGLAYTMAHTTATLETLSRIWLRSSYRPDWLQFPFAIGMPDAFPTIPSTFSVIIGFALVIIGQAMRSLAMAHANTNFNHIVQSTKKVDHVLITDGVYAFSRHPSYFGFFWWGLGTQLVLSNTICFLVYAVLLWNFFHRRIMLEEEHLVEFFGQEYRGYRDRVPVWIPFIR